MPIEIKELHIKININEGNASNATGGGASDSSAGDMIGECVEQVLETIKKQKER